MFKQFLIILFSTIFAFGTKAQSLDETHRLANDLFALQNYEAAVKHYRRVAFFGDNTIKASVYPSIAKCYLYSGSYNESLFFYQLASNTASSDSLYNEYTFNRALCNILLGNLDYAMQEIYSYNDYGSVFFERKYHFYLGIIYLKKNDINQSQFHFLCASKTPADFDKIVAAYNEINLGRPNPKTAKILSMIIPGSGQLYSGDAFNAANSFLLNAGLTILIFAVAIKQTFLDGMLSFGPWLQRYHTGGYTKAERIAMSKQSQKIDELLGKIYIIFEESIP